MLNNTILRNRYKIISQLGNGGGFGETYLAEDLGIPINPKPRCVVKKLRPQIQNPDVIRLFQQEAATLYTLKHDQIPKLSEFFEENNDFYLIQEYIEGHDLTNEFTPGKQYSEFEVI